MIAPWLWFDTEAEAAARFYTSIFPNSAIGDVTHYGPGAPRPAGTVMTVSFVLDGQAFVALNGGPEHRFNEAVSFTVTCDNQAEVDRYWNALTSGGQERPCGWLKDKFGLSWQIVPTALRGLLTDPDPRRAQGAMSAMLGMHKIELAELERAAAAAQTAA